MRAQQQHKKKQGDIDDEGVQVVGVTLGLGYGMKDRLLTNRMTIQYINVFNLAINVPPMGLMLLQNRSQEQI